jgi:hypothetical protein
VNVSAVLDELKSGGPTSAPDSVIFDGKLLVERSRDPQFDAARALLAQGITGKLKADMLTTGIDVR